MRHSANHGSRSSRAWELTRMGVFISILLTAVLGVSAAPMQSRQDDATIRAILEIQGMEGSTRKAILAQLAEAKRKNPDLPASTWQEVEARVNGPALASQLSAVWMSTYTNAELKELLAFLRTQTGKKFIQGQQVLLAKASAAAGIWGMDVYAILQTKHPDRFPVDKKRDQKMRQMFQDALGNGVTK